MEFKPLRRASLYLAIAEQLESYIMSEKLQPGERLPTERDLAQMFGVSRTTVRQALAALEAKGLIESHIGSGTFARRHSAEFAVARLAHMLDRARVRLTEALEARTLLEPQVTRLAAKRAQPADLEEIRVHLQAMEQAHDDSAAWLKHDAAFHRAIAHAARNPIVLTILEVLQSSVQETRGLSLSNPQGLATHNADHRRIFNALQAGDQAGAAAAMSDHLRHVRDLAATVLDQQADRDQAPRPQDGTTGD